MPTAAPRWTREPASEKQLAMIQRLASERTFQYNPTAIRTKGEASTLIDALLRMPREPRKDVSVAEVGMYMMADGTVAKVQKSQQSGNLYAKKLVPIGGQRLSESDEIVGWEFEYAPGLVKELTPEMRLSLEQAKEFGIRYGVCCVCGITLKDAASVAAGIGPVCAKRL